VGLIPKGCSSEFQTHLTFLTGDSGSGGTPSPGYDEKRGALTSKTVVPVGHWLFLSLSLVAHRVGGNHAFHIVHPQRAITPRGLMWLSGYCIPQKAEGRGIYSSYTHKHQVTQFTILVNASVNRGFSRGRLPFTRHTNVLETKIITNFKSPKVRGG